MSRRFAGAFLGMIATSGISRFEAPHPAQFPVSSDPIYESSNTATPYGFR